MNLENTTLHCVKCDAAVTVLTVLVKHIAKPYCEACGDKHRATLDADNRATKLRDHWNKICPDLFRDTTFEKLPKPELSEKALSWKYGSTGLNLWGFPNTGKTRTAYMVLEREHLAGRVVRAFGPGDFAHTRELVKGAVAKWISTVSRYDLVLFDDVDKYSLSSAYEDTLFAIVDQRVKYKRPTIWTGNSGGECLKLMFKNGEALVRRIRNFSKSLHFT
jgi:hypothetical protein